MSSKSSLVSARFDPSHEYLASAVVALDTHQIRVQSITTSQLSLNTSFNLENSNRLSLLSWVLTPEQTLIAIGLTNGNILVYSPLTNQIVTQLSGGGNGSVTDFHYSELTNTAWSSDLNGVIYEWDMSNFSLVQQFSISDVLESVDSINRISTIVYNDQPHLLLGSHSVYLIHAKEKTLVKTFPAHVQPIHTIKIVPGSSNTFFTAAQGDRFINLYSVDKLNPKTVLVAKSAVTDVSLGIKDDDVSIIMALNEAGNVEIFNNPLQSSASSAPEAPSKTPSKKKRRQQMSTVQSRPSTATIKLSRPGVEIKNPDDANIPINAVTFNQDAFIYTWLENGNISYFDSGKWWDKEFVFEKDSIIVKSKPNLKTTSHTVSGHDIAATTHYNEGNTVISDGTNLRDLDVESEDEEETLAEKLEKLNTDQKPASTKKPKKKLGKTTNTATLTIILAQSLKNNDHSLLETVLMNRDPSIVQNTIARLDPSLAVILLDRLSERITRQATRFDHLNFWLKWIIIIHGGVLSSLPNLSTKLANLHAILNKKSNTLPRLLEIQGRLNLLYQQVDLKKEIINGKNLSMVSDDEDEDEVEYIEEIDDARFNGDISEDEVMSGQDDFIDSDLDEEEESDDEDIPNVMDLDEDEEGYSDVEIGVQKDMILDDDEEEKASEAKIKKYLKAKK